MQALSLQDFCNILNKPCTAVLRGKRKWVQVYRLYLLVSVTVLSVASIFQKWTETVMKPVCNEGHRFRRNGKFLLDSFS